MMRIKQQLWVNTETVEMTAMCRASVVTLVVFACLGATATFAADEPGAVQRSGPNIVLVFMDNFGWGEPGFNGGGVTRGAATPRLDQLAAEGLRLTNFNVEAQCTPSRSAIMTGRYAIRSGNSTVPLGTGVYGLVQWEVTMAEMLADAGYATGMFGKWHLGRTPGRYPTDQEGEEPQRVRPYRLDYRPFIDGDLTDRAIDFMERQTAADKPFFLYLPYTATHYPTRPHPDFAGKSGNGAWADLLLQIDAYNGRLLDAIDELGIRDDTLFIFTADNGPEATNYGENSGTIEAMMQGSAGPWRGTLFTGFEGSLRVPFVARWPGKIPAGTSSNEIVHEMDLFPTLAALVGGNVPQDRVIDGVDVSDFFLGQRDKSGREGVIVYMGTEVFGVKWRDWKVNFKEQDTVFGATRSFGTPRVYNLLTDPQERVNVLFPYTWVPQAALGQLGEHAASLRNNPPIRPGTPDPYEPSH